MRQLFFAHFQFRLALSPAFLQSLLTLLVLLLYEALLFLIFVLSFLPLERFLVLIIFDLALTLLLKIVVLLLALTLHSRRLFLPRLALRAYLCLRPLPFPRIILHHLIERRCRHINLVELLQFLPLEYHRLPQRSQYFHLLRELLGNIGKRLAHLQSQPGNLLHYGLDGYSLGALPHLGRVQSRGPLGLSVCGLARRYHLLLDLREFLLHFRFAALCSHGCFHCLHGHLIFLSQERLSDFLASESNQRFAQKFRIAFGSSAESGSEVASVTWTLRTSGIVLNKPTGKEESVISIRSGNSRRPGNAKCDRLYCASARLDMLDEPANFRPTPETFFSKSSAIACSAGIRLAGARR